MTIATQGVNVPDSLAAGVLLSEFAHALDTQNWQAYTELFAPEGRLLLPGGDPVPKPQLAAICQAVLGRFSDTHHMITNVISTPGPAGDLVTANLRASHFYADPDREPWVVVGRYAATTRLHEDALRFESVELTIVWQAGDAPIGM